VTSKQIVSNDGVSNEAAGEARSASSSNVSTQAQLLPESMVDSVEVTDGHYDAAHPEPDKGGVETIHSTDVSHSAPSEQEPPIEAGVKHAADGAPAAEMLQRSDSATAAALAKQLPSGKARAERTDKETSGTSDDVHHRRVQTHYPWSGSRNMGLAALIFLGMMVLATRMWPHPLAMQVPALYNTVERPNGSVPEPRKKRGRAVSGHQGKRRTDAPVINRGMGGFRLPGFGNG
jgi:hypothetical protein